VLFIPVWDTNPLEKIRFQVVTLVLVAANVFIYVVFQSGLIATASLESILGFALIPAELLNAGLFGDTEYQVFGGQTPVPERLTLVSYMFLHGNLMHLVGNMAFLWVFGDNVEDAMGHIRFAMFYLMCGIFAGLVHALAAPGSPQPLIGASGATSGVIAAYLMLHPKVRLWVLALPFFPLRISAGIALGIWVGFQLFSLFFSSDPHTAWWAHVGGLGAGALLILFMRRPGVPLFDRIPGA
jgi:membrane associated rhomboid family serine protease